MKNYKYIILILLVLIVPNVAVAANHYVRAGATGNGSGSDWANAYASLPSALVRGDTYYIADGDYSGYTFDDAVSGSSYIYINKATASAHGTDAGWDSGYGNGVASFTGAWTFGTNYWDIDGVVGSGNSGHGIKLTSGDNTKMVILSNCSHIRLSHIEMDHRQDPGEGHDIVYVASATPSTDLTFSYCYLHDCGRCPFLFRYVTESTIEYCWIEKNHWNYADHSEGISAYLGTGTTIVRYNTWVDIAGTGTLMFAGDGWEIYGNLVYWTGNQVVSAHSDCVFGNWSGKDQSTFGSSNTKIYNNTICDIGGQAGFYMYPGESGNVAYNNLFVNNSSVGLSNITQSNNTTAGSTSLFVNYSGDDFRLSQPTDAGKSDLGSPYNRDMLGNIRGNDGLWDRGAFEYGIGTGMSPTPPQHLQISLN